MTASTSIGRSICGSCPFSSRKPARAESPISVPMVSTKAMMKMVSTMGNARQVSAPRKSSCHTMGMMLGGALTIPCGGAAVCTRKARIAVITMPSRIAPGTLRITRTAIRTNPNMATSAGCEVRFPACTGAPGTPSLTKPGFVQADEGEKQADSHREAVAERSRHAVHDPLPQAQDRHDDEQHACDEDGRQRRLPAKAQHFADREGNESVLAHVRRDGERAVGVERHEVAAERRDQHRRHEGWPFRNSRGRENGRIDYHNVGHRGERRQSGHNLLP